MRKFKKGFTLVELVIVISVIAVLAAVIIPTFAGIINRAKDTAKLQMATNVRDEYYSAHETMVSVEEMKDYVILVDGTAYRVEEQGQLTQIETTLKEYEKDNKVKLEQVLATDGTIFIPVPVVVTEVQGGSYDAEGNMIATWEELVEANIVKVNGTTLTKVASGKVTKLVIDDVITTIGAHAFDSVSLHTVVLSKNVTTIADRAFYHAGVSYVDFNGCQITELGEETFFGSDIVEIAIPEGVTKIGEDCFYANYDLVKVTLPSTLETLDYCAFGNCHKIDGIVLPEGLKTISAMTFFGCYGIKTLVIPESVTKIGYYALDLTANLECIDPEVTYTIRFNFTEATKDVARVIDNSGSDAIYFHDIVDVFENDKMEKEHEEWEKEWAEEEGYEYVSSYKPLTGKLNFVIEVPINPETNDDYYYYGTGINTYCDDLTELIDNLYMDYEMFSWEYSDYEGMFDLIIRDIAE